MPSLADRLRARRHDLTQDEAAAQMGVSKQAYQAWESGKSYPDKHRRRAVAAWLGEDYDDFVDAVNAEKRSGGEAELRREFAADSAELRSQVDALRAEVAALVKLITSREDEGGQPGNGRP